MRILFAALVIDAEGLVKLAVLHQEFEGLGAGGGLGDGFAQRGGGVLPGIHGDQFHRWRDAGLLRGAAVAHVADDGVFIEHDADGVGEVGDLAGLLARLPEIAAHAVVGELPAGALDAAERRAGLGGTQALVEEAGPVVGLHGVERGDDIVEVVRLQRRGAARAAVERLAEIVERLRALAQLADGDIGFPPDQRTFGVIVHAAAQALVIVAGIVEHLGGNGGVFEGAPGAPVLVVQFGGGFGQPGVICLTYSWMSDALKMLPEPVERRVQLALNALRKIYPGLDIASHIIGDPITVSWEADRHFLGAFKGALPGHYRYNHRMYAHFMQDRMPPVQRGIFIAGDDVSWTPAWAEGAVQTSLNAVWGILHHLGGRTHPGNPGPGDLFAGIGPIELPD